MDDQSNEFVGVGEPFPDLSLPTLDGDRLTLRDFQGQKWILFMWASW